MTDDELLTEDEVIGRRKKRLVSNTIVVVGLVIAVFGAKGVVEGVTLRILAMGFALASVALAYVYNRTGAERAALSLLFSATWICIFVAVFTTGVDYAIVLAWLPILVCMAGLLGGKRHCLAWLAVSVATLLALWFLPWPGLEPLEVAEDKVFRARLHVVAQLTVITAVLLSFLDMNAHVQQRAVALQKSLQRQAYLRERAEAATARAERSQAVFLNNMNHEVRTPLNSIIGFSSRLLKRKNLADAQDEEAAVSILRNGKVLLAMINELLELATIESTTLNYSEQPFSLDELIRECVIATEASARSYGLQLQADHLEDVEIYADQARLHQLLVSLLYFCIGQTRDGGVEISLTQMPRDGADGARIRVVDSSNGIAPEQLEGLFETHYQVVLTNNRDLPISALTLTLAAKLVAMHSGTMEVDSKLGQGNCFDIWLPLAPTAA